MTNNSSNEPFTEVMHDETVISIYSNMGIFKKKNLTKVKSNIVESLELPRDIVYGAVIITAMGRREVLIENYKGIIDYTREKIRLQTKNCQVSVVGKQLVVEYYTNEEMKITGFIQGILYDS